MTTNLIIGGVCFIRLLEQASQQELGTKESRTRTGFRHAQQDHQIFVFLEI